MARAMACASTNEFEESGDHSSGNFAMRRTAAAGSNSKALDSSTNSTTVTRFSPLSIFSLYGWKARR
jgi:hypothetical protein